MSLKELKRLLDARGVDYSQCIEKSEFRALAASALLAREGEGGEEGECAICLDGLRQPMSLPCAHVFCRGCVGNMRRFGVAESQVCPLCRGALPDIDLLLCDAAASAARFEKWKREHEGGGERPPARVRQLVRHAAKCCREVLALDTSGGAYVHLAHGLLAHSLHGDGDRDGAIRHYRFAAQHHPPPGDEHACYQLGHLLLERAQQSGRDGDLRSYARDAAEAESFYRNSIAINPLQVDAQVNLAIYLMSPHRGDVDGAEACLRAALAVDGRCGTTLDHLGQLLQEHRGEMEGAERCFRKAVEFEPRDAKHHVSLGGFLITVRADKPGAAAAFRKALTLAPDMHTRAEANHGLGQILQTMSVDLPGALAHFRAATEANPNWAEAHLSYGKLLEAVKDTGGALRAFRAAVAADPKHVDAQYWLGMALGKSGGPSRPGERTSTADEAAAHFRIVLTLDPSHARAKRMLATTQQKNGDDPSPEQFPPGFMEALETLRQQGKTPMEAMRLAFQMCKD